MNDAIEAGARAAARVQGDDFDKIPRDKPHWTAERGHFNGRFRDINEPFQSCYLEMSEEVIKAAIASGALVPASAGQPSERPVNKIIEGAKEALAVAKGEKPAARICVQGHAYVPASAVVEMRERAARFFEESAHFEWYQHEIAAAIRQLDTALTVDKPS